MENGDKYNLHHGKYYEVDNFSFLVGQQCLKKVLRVYEKLETIMNLFANSFWLSIKMAVENIDIYVFFDQNML
jgi:hypothetical protein